MKTTAKTVTVDVDTLATLVEAAGWALINGLHKNVSGVDADKVDAAYHGASEILESCPE